LLDVSVKDSTVRLHHLTGGAAQILADGHTRFEGLTRNSFPYVGEGQLVQVDARFCKVPGVVGNKIVARRIAAAGPIVPASTAEDVLGANWRGRSGAVSERWLVNAVVAVALIAAGTILVRHRSNRPAIGA